MLTNGPKSNRFPPGEVRFQDLHGMDTAIEEMKPLVEMIRNTHRFVSRGITIPRGIILEQAPDSETDELIRAVATEAGASVIWTKEKKFNLTHMDEAREQQPAILVVSDKCLMLGNYGRTDHSKIFMNAMKSIQPEERIWVFAKMSKDATPQPNVFKPGRFEKRVLVPSMNSAARESFLRKTAAAMTMECSNAIAYLAKIAEGWSKPCIQNMLNQAAIRAEADGREVVAVRDVVHAHISNHQVALACFGRDGMETIRAYHEAGHALVWLHTAAEDAWMFLTILATGKSGGFMQFQHSSILESIPENKQRLACYMGGRVAEEVLLGRGCVTQGAAKDFEMAMDYAKQMVMNYGMGASGLIYNYDKSPQTSQSILETINADIQVLLQEALETARRILCDRRADLDAVARALVEHKILTKEDILEILAKNQGLCHIEINCH